MNEARQKNEYTIWSVVSYSCTQSVQQNSILSSSFSTTKRYKDKQTLSLKQQSICVKESFPAVFVII